MLFMPGDSMRKIEKAIGLGVDCIVMDGDFWSKVGAHRNVVVPVGETYW